MSRLSKLSRSISGKVAIVTGAASGMGRATAHLFIDEGARVALVDINEQALETVAKEIRDVGGDVITITTDCSVKEQVVAAVEKTAAHFGGIDILINNAGLSIPEQIEDDNYETGWQRSMNVMVNAQQWAILAALPHLRKAEHARIINVASTEALGATPHNTAYVVAKTAALGLTRAMAVELGPEGITVNCICPGPINTAITSGISDEHKIIFAKRRTALKRYGMPEEVAQITLSLVLPAASYITGATVPVDGGLTIRNA